MLQIIYAWDYVEWGGAQIYHFALMREASKKYKVTALVPENSSPRIFEWAETHTKRPLKDVVASLTVDD